MEKSTEPATTATTPKRTRSLRRRIAGIALGAVAFVLVLALAAALAVPLIDWNRAKGWVERRVSAALGRELTIDGDLHVAWRWDSAHRVHPWLPRLHVSADGLHLANVSGARAPTFAECKRIELDLRPWALAAHEIAIGGIHATDPVLHLERRADNSNNWTFAAERDADGAAAQDGSSWHFRLGRIQFDSGHFAFDDAVRKLHLEGDITPLGGPEPFDQVLHAQDGHAAERSKRHVGKQATDEVQDGNNAPRTPTSQPFRFAWKASGKSAGRPIEGSGKIGGLLGFQDDEEPWPVQGELRAGDTQIAVVGTVRNPSDVSAIDLRLWFAGASMSDLYPLLRITLPATKPFSTDGHLSGEIHPHGNRFAYENFHGRVGDSDLSGNLVYDGRHQQSNLSGNVDSKLLQLVDLGPLVGADGAQKDSAKTPAERAHAVLPTGHLGNERWAGMDASVDFSAKRLMMGSEALPVSEIRTHIALDHGVLTLEPLKFAIAGGAADAALQLDGNTAPPHGKFKAAAHGLKIKELFPGVSLMRASIGEINGDVGFTTHGVSVADLLGHADGELKLLVEDGSVSKAALEKAGLNLANFAITRLTGDSQVRINCAAADFGIDDGVLQSKLVVFDTEDALVRVDGTISLKDETLALTAHPDAKGVRVLSLRSPLKIRGTFQHASVDVDKRALFARGGGAVALAAIAPVAALIPLTAPSHDSTSQRGCHEVLEKLRQDASESKRATKRTR